MLPFLGALMLGYGRSEGYARTGYWIPGRDGMGAGRGQEILPPPPPSSSPSSPTRPRARLGQVGFKASGASSATHWRHSKLR